MILPNTLTVSRIVLTFIFIILIMQNGVIPKMIAAIVFAIASFTDFYDGYLAKKHDMVSDFGKLMDPIADKFLILAAFVVFTIMGILPFWMFFIIFARELLITALRLYAKTRGRILAAENLGKYKTVSQIFVTFYILIYIVFEESGVFKHFSEGFVNIWYGSIYFFMLFTVILTLVSGISYVVSNKHLFNENSFR